MATPDSVQPMLFTVRRNGDSDGKRLVEILAEPVEQLEAPAGAAKQSWFGSEDDVAAVLEKLGFPQIDVEGVVGSLHTNRDAVREVDVLPSALKDAKFGLSV